MSSRFFAILFFTGLAILSSANSSREARDKPRPGKLNRDREKDKSVASATDGGSESYCDLEVTCKGGDDASLPTSMKLPIRGARGPPGTPGDRGERGDDGVPGMPGLSGQ